MSIFGTRPEAIKMAPVVKELEARDDVFESVVVVTAQHREMLDQVLSIFDLVPDYDLNIMKPRQTLSEITSRVLLELDSVLEKESPDMVLVHGDTTTSFVASLAAFYHGIKIGHVEAGLRTWDKYAPYPEEMNRQMTDVLSDYYFAPTKQSKQNLVMANIKDEHIYVTGNTVVDAIKETTLKGFDHPVMSKFNPTSKKVLLTMHRRENLGKPMTDVFKAVKRLVQEQTDLEVVYPVHANPVVKQAAEDILGDESRVHLIAPMDVVEFHNCMNECYFIMSDSGGVQEEAPSLNKPVLVLRDTTERPEGLETGILTLVGTDEETVYSSAKRLLTDADYYQTLIGKGNPYGDGLASKRIVDVLATING